jgi:hypothetical protein
MTKRKYEKPTSMNLDAIEIANGSCWSGNVEHTVGTCITTGGLALQTCGGGGTVYPRQVCSNGAFAGYSCVNGSNAG